MVSLKDSQSMQPFIRRILKVIRVKKYCFRSCLGDSNLNMGKYRIPHTASVYKYACLSRSVHSVY